MKQAGELESWEVRYPRPGTTGIYLARGLLEHSDSLLLRSAPEVLTVEIRDTRANRLAYGPDLERTLSSLCARYAGSVSASSERMSVPAQLNLNL